MAGRLRHTCSPLKDFQVLPCKECERQKSIECTCPDGWFPAVERDVLKKYADGCGCGMLKHHFNCQKSRS